VPTDTDGRATLAKPFSLDQLQAIASDELRLASPHALDKGQPETIGGSV